MKALFRPTLLTAITLVLATSLILSPKPKAAQAQSEMRAQSTPGPAPTTGPDKSQNELRQENQRLREKIAELDAQVAESKRRIAKLEDTIRTLNNAQSAKPATAPGAPAKPGAAPTPAPQPVTAQLPDDPYAAPDAMAAVLEKEFAQALGAKPREGDIEMDRYVRDAKRWARQVAQTHRKPVDWTVQALDPLPKKASTGGVPEPAPATGGEATFVVVNPGTHATLGGPFKVMLSAHDFAKLREEPKSGLWSLSGVFGATPEVVYPESAEPKVFNPPHLIGQFVEYRYEFAVKALSAYAPPVPAEPAMK